MDEYRTGRLGATTGPAFSSGHHAPCSQGTGRQEHLYAEKEVRCQVDRGGWRGRPDLLRARLTTGGVARTELAGGNTTVLNQKSKYAILCRV